MVYVTLGCPNAAVTKQHREACSKRAAAFLASGREGRRALCDSTCLAPEHPSEVAMREDAPVRGSGQLWELQVGRWRDRWRSYLALGKIHPSDKLWPEACKLRSGVTIPKRNVHAVLEERTFIPAFFFFFPFYLTQCLNVHHWYCGSEISCNARPDSIHHSSRFAASSLQQLVFPHSSCSAVCVQVTCRGAVPAGGKRLCLSWPGKTAGSRDSGAGGGLLPVLSSNTNTLLPKTHPGKRDAME